MTRALMLQGTGSDVGKSLIVAGLARVFTRRGLTVRPFKPQNMSNNAAVTADGGEIGRAQALQARACGVAPRVDMNPVLLKPETDTGAQVVVQGKRLGHAKARDYQALKPTLLSAVLESFERLSAEADLVLVEGAGSPAEVNLRAGDIANMGFAEAAGVPVVLVADIHRGGVIASLVGTHAVLTEADRRHVAGYLINKFRGDVSLFDEGLAIVERHTGWPSFGVVPHFAEASRLPAEDAMTLEERRATASKSGVHIAVLALSRIANFDDFDPLRQEEGVRLTFVEPGEALPGDVDLAILPGSKSTLGDLAFLRAQGWDTDLLAHRRRGGRILGICAGMQMLGRSLSDPEGLDGPPGRVEGLGLLDLETLMTPDKRLEQASGCHLPSGEAVEGYEMHLGRTEGADLSRPLLELAGQPDGARTADGLVEGCYLHGLFAADGFRRAYLAGLGHRGGSGESYEAAVETTLDRLAEHLEVHLDIDGLLAVAERALRVPT